MNHLTESPSFPTNSVLFDLTCTIASELFQPDQYPWQILDAITDFIDALGKTLDPLVFEQRGEHIWIARDAVISPTAFIGDHVIIDAGAEIRHCAFIRGSAIIGKNAVVGNSTELKNCVLFDNVQVPHYNYVGDSVLGYKAHLGAGAVTSNVKSDKSPVTVRNGSESMETGRKKFGAMLGDHAEVGCNSVLCPGSIIGRNTTIYPLSRVRGVIPSDSIFKSEDKIINKN